MTPNAAHLTRLAAPRRLLCTLLALVGLWLSAAPAGAQSRTISVGAHNGYWTTWTGTIPALSGGACTPLDGRCDGTLLLVQSFEGGIPCVAVTAHLTANGEPAHIAVYRTIPGIGPPGDPLAISYDGTLMFWAEPNSVHRVEIGSAKLFPTFGTLGYSAQVSTRDIGFGPGTTNGDFQLCVPGAWAADSAEQLVVDHT